MAAPAVASSVPRGLGLWSLSRGVTIAEGRLRITPLENTILCSFCTLAKITDRSYLFRAEASFGVLGTITHLSIQGSEAGGAVEA